ncbi:MAG: nuclear transport factor 2 family protein [Acidobacteriota bacterium]|nr:nuclear transport factor 2 family protein [Acidobacteriota bacterium]
MKKIAFILIIALASTSMARNVRVSAGDLAAIRAVLDEQAAAWNRGDIDGYMAGYARSDDTIFVGTDVTRGWTKVRDRYKAKYDSRAKMGTLEFSDVDLRALGGDDIVVTGAWKLTREADTPHGRFTLIVHRRPEGWRIVYDHSS